MPLPPPDPEYLAKAVASGPGSRQWSALSNRFGNLTGNPEAVESIEAQFGENLQWFDDSISVSDFLNSDLSQDWRQEDPLEKTDRFVKLRKMDTTRTDAVPISDVPTTTTNPERPRTIAAGYDPLRETMTIVFRDGTYYNYYGVSQGEWGVFRRARAKGGKHGPIDSFLNAKRRGKASSADQSGQVQEVLYRIARTAQLIYKGGRSVPKTAAQGRPSYDARKRLQQFKRWDSARKRYVVTRTPERRYSKPTSR